MSGANHAHMIRDSRQIVLPTQTEIGSGLLLEALTAGPLADRVRPLRGTIPVDAGPAVVSLCCTI